MPGHKIKKSESGFALLFVMAMASTVAIMLYLELPSVTFEAQRDREQLLIDRGEQYSRAVNLYVRKFNKYPADFDALENTQNIRFLRHRYVDPMTGKEEWRIIHVGPGGVFTDSLVYNKPVNSTGSADTFSTVLTQMQQAGGAPVDPNAQGGAGDVGARLRPSEAGGGLNAPADPNNPLNTPGSPSSTLSGIGGTGSAPLLAIPGSAPPGFPIAPGTNQPALPGQPGGSQFPLGTPPGNGAPGQAQPGNAAANLINGLLTSPRPGGFPGLQTGQTSQQTGQPTVDQFGNPIQPTGATGQPAGTLGTSIAPAGLTGQTVGGGMAGVASKRERQGIKLYNDRKKYNEWEFVYDASKDPARVGTGAAPVNNVPPANGATGTTGTTGATGFTGLGQLMGTTPVTPPPPPPPPN